MKKDKFLIENIKLITVFEDLPMGSILLNENGQIIMANNIFLDKFSFTKEKLIGKSIGSILSFPTKKKYTDFRGLFDEASPTKKQITEIKDPQGIVYRIEFSLYDSVVGKKKFYMGFIVINREEKDLKKELKKQITLKDSIKDELEQENELSEMKSRFLSIASHEFRTPLAGILSSLNLIDRYLEADQQTWFQFKNRKKVANHLSKINESVRNLTTILQKFLALGNIEKGEIPIKYAKINLKKNIEAQSLQLQEICKPGQNISYKHKGHLTIVALDKYLLKNILNNLLSNAINYSHENSEIQLTSEVTPKTVNIIIKDKGIGIPEAEQGRIFRRFFRANNALTFQEGTGLGLNIVKNYVERMNGNITFESKENVGTTFNVTFPNKTI